MLEGFKHVAQGLESLRDVARVDPGGCTRIHGSGCTACVDACPQVALRLDGAHRAPQVEALSCIGCGVCVPACPTQAVTDVGTPPGDVARAARDNPAGLTVRCGALAGRELPGAGAVLGVWCLGALHPETLAGAASRMDGDARLTLAHADCGSCPVRAPEQVRETVAAATSLAARTGRGARVVGVEHAATEPSEPQEDRQGPSRRSPRRARRPAREKPAMSRRALFGSLLGRADDLDTADAPTPTAPGVGRGAPGRPVTAAGAVTAPRGVLLASSPEAALPRPHAVPGCTACQACTTICPTDALSWLSSPTASALLADPAACISCGECVRVCPEEVLSLVCPAPRPGVPDRGNDPVILTRVPRARCTRCRRTLSADERGTCTACRSRRAMLDDVWAQHE